MNLNQEKDIFDDHSLNNENIGTSQVVLHIPSDENECDLPTLLVCSSKANLPISENNLYTSTLDDLIQQVKENYANDPQALQRFSYYLVLKAQEISEVNSKIS